MEFIENRTFFIRKLHSLLGIIPIGLFLFEHLFTNSFAVQGAASFNDKAEFFKSIPILIPIEILVIALPILFHGFYGLYIVYLARNNVLSYSYYRNWMFYLQRITAVITLLFVCWHAWNLRIATALNGTEVSFETMAELLSNQWILAIYVIGLLSALFHFANGLWAFLVSWGITIGTKAQNISAVACAFVFVGLTALGIFGLTGFLG
jgi:succinate dehydrogenase / fumarate reductase, cytochrome b subunit